jgi:hypothetical protein
MLLHIALDASPLRELYRRRTPDEEATWYKPFVTADGTPIQENIRIALISY